MSFNYQRDQLAAVQGKIEYVPPGWYQPPAWSSGHIGGVEAAFLAALVAEGQPESVLEIGVAGGGSTCVLLHALRTLGGRRRLDSWDVDRTCYFNRQIPIGRMVGELLPDLDLTRGPVCWHLHQGDARQAARTGPRVALALIDGNHRHPWPVDDLLAVLPLVAPGGWVAFHDVHVDRLWPHWMAQDGGATRLWRALVQLPALHWRDAGPRSNIGALAVPADRAGFTATVERIRQEITATLPP